VQVDEETNGLEFGQRSLFNFLLYGFLDGEIIIFMETRVKVLFLRDGVENQLKENFLRFLKFKK
jgi:hypothetical protein